VNIAAERQKMLKAFARRKSYSTNAGKKMTGWISGGNQPIKEEGYEIV
jgi:hypothetical protein